MAINPATIDRSSCFTFSFSSRAIAVTDHALYLLLYLLKDQYSSSGKAGQTNAEVVWLSLTQ